MVLLNGPVAGAVAACRYRKPGNMTWFECHQRMHSSKPEQLKDNLLYVSGMRLCRLVLMLLQFGPGRNTWYVCLALLAGFVWLAHAQPRMHSLYISMDVGTGVFTDVDCCTQLHTHVQTQFHTLVRSAWRTSRPCSTTSSWSASRSPRPGSPRAPPTRAAPPSTAWLGQ